MFLAFPDFILGILSKITIFGDIFLTVLIIILSFKYKKYFPAFLAVAQTGLVLWYELSGKAPEMNSTFYIDRLTVILLLIVSVVGTLITVYACGYMKDYHKHHAEVMNNASGKKCSICKSKFTLKAKNQRYCPKCAERQKRLKAAERQRKKRALKSRF